MVSGRHIGDGVVDTRRERRETPLLCFIVSSVLEILKSVSLTLYTSRASGFLLFLLFLLGAHELATAESCPRDDRHALIFAHCDDFSFYVPVH
jgi:hypothetical protein